jgi:signal transduction histidine kinase
MTFRKKYEQKEEEPAEGHDRAFEQREKQDRAAELELANIELAYQNEQKEQRAQELVIANKELAYQNEQKEKRANELVIANKELAYQNEQKEKRAAELVIANKELAYQNEQKEKRARELVIANRELAYQNEQKEQRAAELELANIELAYQNEQKEHRAQELALANIELAYQNEQKEKRAAELAQAIKDLEAFAYVSSHHLQEPLRKIRSFVDRVLDRDAQNLSEKGRHDLGRIDVATARMSQLIQDVYTYSRINVMEPDFEPVAAGAFIEEVIGELQEHLEDRGATITANVPITVHAVPQQFRQVIHQLLDNSLKFSRPGTRPHISISGRIVRSEELESNLQASGESYCCIEVTDNGIGFDSKFNESIFRIFEKLHPVEEYPGTGIGLAIVKKIMDRHKGAVSAAGEPGVGATFRLYFPVEPVNG